MKATLRILLAGLVLLAFSAAASSQDVYVTPSVLATDGAGTAGAFEVLVASPPASTQAGLSLEGSFLFGVPVVDGYGVYLTPLAIVTVQNVYASAGAGPAFYKEANGEHSVALGIVFETGVVAPIGSSALLLAVRAQEYNTRTDNLLGRIMLRAGVTTGL